MTALRKDIPMKICFIWKLSKSLAENIEMFKNITGRSSDLVIRNFTLGRSNVIPAAIFYFDNLVDSKQVDTNILQQLLTDSYSSGLKTGAEIIKDISLGNLITRAQVKSSEDVKELIDNLMSGNVLLFADGLYEVYIIRAISKNYRPLSEAEVETVVRGPRDAFNEVLSTNLGLIRKRIHSPNLIFEVMTVGKITETKVCIGYMKGICSQKLVKDIRSKINNIDTDVILSDSYIEEAIGSKPFSLFPQMRNTERPDVASAALLEGRVVIVVDNTPVVLIAPGEFFHSCSLLKITTTDIYFQAL